MIPKTKTSLFLCMYVFFNYCTFTVSEKHNHYLCVLRINNTIGPYVFEQELNVQLLWNRL